MIDPQKCKSTIACTLGTCVHARLITSFPWTSAQCAVYSHVQSIYRGVHLCLWNYIRLVARDASAKNISVRAEWLRQSGRAPSEPSETPRWQITQRPASTPRVALHIALRSPFRRFFSLCRSPILDKHSGVVANCDHTSERVHWVHACIGIAIQWVTLRKSHLVFLLR